MKTYRMLVVGICLFGSILLPQSGRGQSAMQALKVYSIVGGFFDTQSQENLQTLSQYATEHGGVTLWVATNAPYDAHILPSNPAYDEQLAGIREYHLAILKRLHIEPESADLTATGPYLSVSADVPMLHKLLVARSIKGYWGLVPAQ